MMSVRAERGDTLFYRLVGDRCEARSDVTCRYRRCWGKLSSRLHISERSADRSPMSVLIAPTFNALNLAPYPAVPGIDRAAVTVVVLTRDTLSEISLATFNTLSRGLGPFDRLICVGPVAISHAELAWVESVVANPDDPASWLPRVLADLDTSLLCLMQAEVCPVGPWLDQLAHTLGERRHLAVSPLTNLGAEELLIDIALSGVERAAGLQARTLHLAAVTPISARPVASIGLHAVLAHTSLWADVALARSNDELVTLMSARAHGAVAESAFLCQTGDAEWLDDGLDWNRIEVQTHQAIRRWEQRWLEPGCALVDPSIVGAAGCLAELGWDSVDLDVQRSCVDQLDDFETAEQTRPTLLLVGASWVPQLDLVDVAVVRVAPGLVFEQPSTVFADADATVEQLDQIEASLEALDTKVSFGTALQACRVALGQGDLRVAFDALHEARQWHHDAPQVLNALAVGAVLMERHDEAVQLVTSALVAAPDFRPAVDNAIALGLIELDGVDDMSITHENEDHS
jgi:hypothetical protein